MSAHQSEGNSTASDSWLLETNRPTEPADGMFSQAIVTDTRVAARRQHVAKAKRTLVQKSRPAP